MYEQGGTCPVCGADALEQKVVEEIFTYKDQTLAVPGYVVYECAACGEAVVDPASSQRASKLLKDFARGVDGLLTAAEIKRIRKKLGYTQEQMAEVCGGGLKGFARYESGQVMQSKGMDNLLRILDELPFALDVINRRPAKASAKVVSLMDYRSKSPYTYAESPHGEAYSDHLKSALG
ncbi:type II toxin-antitoxin system MqsA family antitoxin [Trichlorobacter lovleyi]|uniref:type II toxin-antitoxin system MqsA family antitoxin n=1 Tax=Trichlorobacter lovleyi TaxID=313985 RepID=UPI0022403348|nr:type II toxin-antitoxin system MqsA family antitoxin [Trichlorobacter lovleyi]QOX77538.1 type II toxin-antitoxin system MqsA family antitoxin [Trichlorobacter lovleyi]